MREHGGGSRTANNIFEGNGEEKGKKKIAGGKPNGTARSREAGRAQRKEKGEERR